MAMGIAVVLVVLAVLFFVARSIFFRAVRARALDIRVAAVLIGVLYFAVIPTVEWLTAPNPNAFAALLGGLALGFGAWLGTLLVASWFQRREDLR
jgi:hypothetical protein